MKVETVSIDKLIPDPSNARSHNPKNIDAIKGSLAKFGFQKPIVIDANNVVIAGNGTLEAAKALGLKDVPCVRTELKGAEAIAFAVSDNRSAELASWDDDVLGKHLQALREDDWDLSALGFDDELNLAENGTLPDSLGLEEKNICQMTFIVHVDQKETIDECIKKAKNSDAFDYDGNDNSNGNALYGIMCQWLQQRT